MILTLLKKVKVFTILSNLILLTSSICDPTLFSSMSVNTVESGKKKKKLDFCSYAPTRELFPNSFSTEEPLFNSNIHKFSTVHRAINTISPKDTNPYSILLVGFLLSVISSMSALVKRIIWFLKWQIALGPIKSCILNVQTSSATGGQAYKGKWLFFNFS